ncbi:hypothetical protein KI387_016707, partial [Taxus chinensis]
TYFQDDLKGVRPSLGEMNIKLKEGVHPIRKMHYRMNPDLRMKVKEEIDKML